MTGKTPAFHDIVNLNTAPTGRRSYVTLHALHPQTQHQGRPISSTLVESYRNEAGQPRLRVLANLHGEPDTLSALAKLAVQRADLRREKEDLDKEMVEANQFYEIVTANTLQGRKYDATERKEIDRLMIARKRLLKRVAQVDAALAVIQRDGAVIKKHCAATPEEIQAGVQRTPARCGVSG